jgi:hypothetical protein
LQRALKFIAYRYCQAKRCFNNTHKNRHKQTLQNHLFQFLPHRVMCQLENFLKCRNYHKLMTHKSNKSVCALTIFQQKSRNET